MKHEAPGYSSRLASFLIAMSVWFLPPVSRRRYHDEWMAELEEMACQDNALVGPALRILLGAPSVARALQTQGQRNDLQEGLLERLTTTTPTASVQHLVLGSQLHRLRESRGISAEQAAEAIRCSHFEISQMEHGRVGSKERDVSDLLTLYGVTDGEERAALLNLAGEGGTVGWWHPYSDILPFWLEPHVGLEAAASVIRTYQIQLIPELLQTEDYARALIRPSSAASEAEIARRAELRAYRQEMLSRPDAPQLRVVVDESALHRIVGSREIIREQLKHLIEMADHPVVTLQILPFASSAHPSAVGPFTILLFAEHDFPKVVHIEHLTSALYLDKPAEVSSYLKVMEQLCHQAAPTSKTNKIIRKILADT